MLVRRLEEAGAFLDAAAPLLLADEARHNLLLGILSTLRDAPAHYPSFRLWLVEQDGEPVAAALRTPPHPLALARPARPEALGALAGGIEEQLPGVVAALPEAEDFAAAWARRRGIRPRRRMAQGIYALESVVQPPPAPGAARAATAADAPLLAAWYRAFAAEASPDGDPGERDARAAVEHLLAAPAGGFALWEDGVPSCLAGYGRPTPSGVRVGPVYTPPALRGRGYASSLVAWLSADLLAGGRRFCFLYTDLANPTANALYRRIGYELVCESAEIAFA